MPTAVAARRARNTETKWVLDPDCVMAAPSCRRHLHLNAGIDQRALRDLLGRLAHVAGALEHGRLALDPEQTERLETATHHWREAVAGRVAPARACLCWRYEMPLLS